MSTVLDDVTDDQIDAAHVRRRVDDWARRVSDLLEKIEHWLPDGWSASPGEPTCMDEELMRKFGVSAKDMPTLRLAHEAGDTAELEPRGLWIIGANGRVDLTRGGERYLLLDMAESFESPTWHVRLARDRKHQEPLSETWLQRALG